MSRVHQATALLRLAVALLVLMVPSIARAQMDAGSLRALIADQSGGIVPGATVTLTNAATGVAQTLVSDSEGYVAFSPIQRGNYNLRVELSGFRTREIKDHHGRRQRAQVPPRGARDGGRV